MFVSLRSEHGSRFRCLTVRYEQLPSRSLCVTPGCSEGTRCSTLHDGSRKLLCSHLHQDQFLGRASGVWPFMAVNRKGVQIKLQTSASARYKHILGLLGTVPHRNSASTEPYNQQNVMGNNSQLTLQRPQASTYVDPKSNGRTRRRLAHMIRVRQVKHGKHHTTTQTIKMLARQESGTRDDKHDASRRDPHAQEREIQACPSLESWRSCSQATPAVSAAIAVQPGSI